MDQHLEILPLVLLEVAATDDAVRIVPTEGQVAILGATGYGRLEQEIAQPEERANSEHRRPGMKHEPPEVEKDQQKVAPILRNRLLCGRLHGV